MITVTEKIFRNFLITTPFLCANASAYCKTINGVGEIYERSKLPTKPMKKKTIIKKLMTTQERMEAKKPIYLNQQFQHAHFHRYERVV